MTKWRQCANNVEVTVLETIPGVTTIVIRLVKVQLGVLTLSRAIPKIFPSVCHDIHGRMSAVELTTGATKCAAVIVLTGPALSTIVPASAVIAAHLHMDDPRLLDPIRLNHCTRALGAPVLLGTVCVRIGWNSVCAWFLPT